MLSRPNGPLSDVKVIELAHVMAGPVCGLMLADLGADVIKLEKIPGGDIAREDDHYAIGGESAAFLMVNRGKRGIAVDLKSEGGKRVLSRLLETADVLIENFRRETVARLGIAYDQLRDRYPGLVYCSVSGFGRTGPYADRGGFDLIAQAMSGLMSYTGEGPGRQPVKCGAPVTDICAGFLATIGILSALHHRNRTGEGQMVDTSLFEAGIALSYWQSAIAFASDETPGPLGSAHPLNAPYQAFEAADGWLALGAANQSNWLRLVEALDARNLAEDSRFANNTARLRHRKELEGELTRTFKRRPLAEWLERLERAGVPAGPILNVRQMHRDPQTLARHMVTHVTHARADKVDTIGLPIKLSATPGGPWRSAPLFGEHTREVLAEHGFTDREIDALIDAGAVATADQLAAAAQP